MQLSCTALEGRWLETTLRLKLNCQHARGHSLRNLYPKPDLKALFTAFHCLIVYTSTYPGSYRAHGLKRCPYFFFKEH